MVSRMIVVLLAMCCLAGGRAQAYEFTLLDLGVAEGFSSSKAFGINDYGEVAGSMTDAAGAVSGYYWSGTGAAQQLASLGGDYTRGWGINNQGQIAGVSNGHAALWLGAQGSPVDLQTLGGPTSTAFRINNSGTVIGWSDLATRPDPYYGDFTAFHGFVYQNGQMQDTGTMTTDWPEWDNGYSFAHGINDQGQVVGEGMDTDWGYRAFILNPDGSKTDLGTHPTMSWLAGSATVINDAGLVGGRAADNYDPNVVYPLLWESGQTTATPISMPAEFPFGEIYGINEKGEMVGVMWNAEGTERAFLYDQLNGVRDLNSLLDPSFGWDLQYASGINELGQIVGFGSLNGATRGYVLNVVPEPVSMALFGIGGLALAAGRRLRRKA
jgi:probable HAF family extracellular repeat protein